MQVAEPGEQTAIATTVARSPLAAAGLNLMSGFLGYWYLKKWGRGAAWLVGLVGLLSLTSVFGVLADLAAFLLYLAGIADAYMVGKVLRDGRKVAKHKLFPL